MSVDSEPHVFVSYVREDRLAVERLCAEFERQGVAVWLDRERIRPGERWQIAIRRAIEDGAVFIACFSTAYGSRGSSYMNVELAIAVEQLRSRPADRAWFIPVLLEGGAVPDRPIGGGETLRDIQWVDLAEDWNDGVRRILNVLRPESPKPPPKPSPHEPATRVILMADLVGSTNIAERMDVDKFRRVLSVVLQIWTDAVMRHGGKTINLFGDGMLATFDSAPQAVACAVAIHHDMGRTRDLKNLRHRLGLSAGPDVTIDGDVFGSTVNLAARICSLAGAGEILISESVYRLIMAEGFQVRERGPVALKGFVEKVRIYVVCR